MPETRPQHEKTVWAVERRMMKSTRDGFVDYGEMNHRFERYHLLGEKWKWTNLLQILQCLAGHTLLLKGRLTLLDDFDDDLVVEGALQQANCDACQPLTTWTARRDPRSSRLITNRFDMVREEP